MVQQRAPGLDAMMYVYVYMYLEKGDECLVGGYGVEGEKRGWKVQYLIDHCLKYTLLTSTCPTIGRPCPSSAANLSGYSGFKHGSGKSGRANARSK